MSRADKPAKTSIHALTQLPDGILSNSSNNGLCIIGIDGCGGSGKSTIARHLQKITDKSYVVEMDDLYRP